MRKHVDLSMMHLQMYEDVKAVAPVTVADTIALWEGVEWWHSL